MKVGKGGWRYQRRFLRGCYMWFIIRHSLFRLIITWTMFTIWCLFWVCLCVYVFSKSVPNYTVPSSQERESILRLYFFHQSQVYAEKSNLYETSHICTCLHAHTPLCGPPLPGWNSKLLQLLQSHNNSHGTQEDELLLLASFLPVTIK